MSDKETKAVLCFVVFALFLCVCSGCGYITNYLEQNPLRFNVNVAEKKKSENNKTADFLEEDTNARDLRPRYF